MLTYDDFYFWAWTDLVWNHKWEWPDAQAAAHDYAGRMIKFMGEAK